MITAVILIVLYLVIPAIAIVVSGRKVTFLGWLLLTLFWPIAWLIWSEELP